MKVVLKNELTVEMVIENKMSIAAVYRYYYPGATMEEVDFFFWECTPFPFDTKEAIRLLYKKYVETMHSLYPQTKGFENG